MKWNIHEVGNDPSLKLLFEDEDKWLDIQISKRMPQVEKMLSWGKSNHYLQVGPIYVVVCKKWPWLMVVPATKVSVAPSNFTWFRA